MLRLLAHITAARLQAYTPPVIVSNENYYYLLDKPRAPRYSEWD